MNGTDDDIWLTTVRSKMNVDRWIRFGIVGGLGFLTEALILHWLVSGLSLSPFIARAVSFPTAVSVTWWLHRRFTFGNARVRAAADRYIVYFMGQVLGAITNLALYAGAICTMPVLAGVPIVPLAIGSVAGLLVNYNWANRFVFR